MSGSLVPTFSLSLSLFSCLFNFLKNPNLHNRFTEMFEPEKSLEMSIKEVESGSKKRFKRNTLGADALTNTTYF